IKIMILPTPASLPYLQATDEQLVETTLQLAKQQTAENLNDDLKQSFQAIYAVEPEPRQLVLQCLAGRVAEAKAPIGMGYIYVFLGANIEGGFKSELTLPYLWNQFFHYLEQLPVQPDTSDLDEAAYEQVMSKVPEISAELAAGLQWMGQGLVAHLARAPELRKTLAADTDLLELLINTEFNSYGIGWVQHVLSQYSDDLILIHAEAEVGVKVRYENFANSFHLFTLLQASLAKLMPGAKPVNKLAVRVARHLSSADANDEAWWHYGSCLSPEPNIMSSIWGEMSPKYIDRLDGEQIILLWSPILATRTWDSGFYHPFLEACPPKVELLEFLSATEVAAYLAKVKAQATQRAKH
ncbi:MAG TPA: hypothetical protein PLM98_04295, partial [Thiolinea sp.]|nr:hypothetical protein [Thiolinea sp.]